MRDIPGDRLRSRVLQPAVDAVFVRLRVNCFALAAAVLATHVAAACACLAHDALTGGIDPVDVVTQGMFAAMAGTGATHLLAFARRDHRGAFRVVHPFFRMAYVFFFSMCWLYPVLVIPRYAALAAFGTGHGGLAWRLAADAGFETFALGFMLAGCEWRRLPPARRRESAGLGRMSPSPT